MPLLVCTCWCAVQQFERDAEQGNGVRGLNYLERALKDISHCAAQG